MRFKKFLSTVCASALLFSSIFPCNAMLFGEAKFNYKVCFVGDSQTGKTSIAKRLANEDFRANEPQTIGSEFYLVNSGDINLQIWNVPGLENFHSLIQAYLRGSSVVCIFLDVSKDDYNDRLDYWLYTVDIGSPDSKKIIVLSKTDLQEVSSKLEAAKQAIRNAHNDIPSEQIISCSAKNDTGIEDLKGRMFDLAQQVRQEEQQQRQEQQRQKRRKNLTIGSLVAAGMVTICYGAHAVYKRFTSKDKDKNLNTDKLKKNHNKTRVTA